ncbi:hypothetical protein PHYPSEUDO_012412 [Phytophthora pseudosyringae]|uniref:Ubiquitin-like domain-containing protein n=1 Tax=Phytophthora pseudosyringae TaxID=221518 RepID=A0A8T1WGY2_9STRA|nr:hypothetical protein PHYPSEUDO_012412 [Phytophthora pseudosyringae]
MAASESSSLGFFWGPAGRLPRAGSSRQGSSCSSTGITRTVQLPRLVAQTPLSGSSASLVPVLPPETQAPLRDGAATSLLEVLHTLLRSIKSDMGDFMKGMRAMDPPADNTVHFVGQNGPRYYSPGVAAEDREFFVRERKMDADREAALAATAQARERHCAAADKPFYTFDRRKRTRATRTKRGVPRRHNFEDTAETARIDRHRRKIEHLLYILQDEIAKETRREIEFLGYSGPTGPGSRQARRHMALIIKARYETADRIMRILERRLRRVPEERGDRGGHLNEFILLHMGKELTDKKTLSQLGITDRNALVHFEAAHQSFHPLN